MEAVTIVHFIKSGTGTSPRLAWAIAKWSTMESALCWEGEGLRAQVVSESLGYKNPDFLCSKYSDLCKKLTVRYRKSRRYLERIQPPNRIQADDETIKDALQGALNESVTPSLQEIRKRLGYKSKYGERYILQRRFP